MGPGRSSCSLTLTMACAAVRVCVAAPPLPPQDLNALARKYPELKQVQADGLPIRVAREDWSAAQRQIAGDAGWKKWLDDRQRRLDDWIAKFKDRPEWVSGWQHDLVEPKSQGPVKWTLDMPEPPNGEGRAQKFKQAWVSYSRSYNIDRILEAARLYRLTGERRYADWAGEQIDFYARNYASWPLRTWNGKARMMGQSLDEATASVQLIEATRLLDGFMSRQRLSAWRSGLFEPMVSNLRDFNQGVNNIALWHAVAIALVGFRFDDVALIADGLNGPRGVRALMARGVTADFIWYEGSFTYNDYVLMALNSLFVQASLMAHHGDLKREMLIAQNMLLAPIAFRFPDGKLPTPSDSNPRAPAVNPGFYATLRRVLPTRIGVDEARKTKSWDTLVDPPEPSMSVLPPLPPVVTANFEGVRMAVLKSDAWQVFLHYGQLTAAHAQSEALNYELYQGSVPVTVDQGTASYGSTLYANYFRRGVAHNVPLVDGNGQEGWAQGNVVRFSADASVIEVAQPGYRSDASATRRLEIINGSAIDRTTITLAPAVIGQRRLGLVFNTECRVDLDSGGLSAPLPTYVPAGSGFEYWTDVSQRIAPAHWNGRLICKGASLRLTVRASSPHSVYQASVPSHQIPARREALYLELLGREASFEMQFRVEQ